MINGIEAKSTANVIADGEMLKALPLRKKNQMPVAFVLSAVPPPAPDLERKAGERTKGHTFERKKTAVIICR